MCCQLPADLRDRARRDLERLGVVVRTGARRRIESGVVHVGDERLEAGTICGPPACRPRRSGHARRPARRVGRVKVQPICRCPCAVDLVVGDLATLEARRAGRCRGSRPSPSRRRITSSVRSVPIAPAARGTSAIATPAISPPSVGRRRWPISAGSASRGGRPGCSAVRPHPEAHGFRNRLVVSCSGRGLPHVPAQRPPDHRARRRRATAGVGVRHVAPRRSR